MSNSKHNKQTSSEGKSSSSFISRLLGKVEKKENEVVIQSPTIVTARWRNIFSSSPETDLVLPKQLYDTAADTASNVMSLSEQLKDITEKLVENKTVEKVDSLVSYMKNIADKVFGTEITGIAAGMSTFEIVMDTMVCIESVLAVIAKALTPMSVITCLYSIFKLIVAIMKKVPIVYKYVMEKFGSFNSDSCEFHDVAANNEHEDELVIGQAEGNHFLNMAYSALIFTLPRKVHYFLDMYQRYTRIRILEDVDWLTSISEILTSVPSFVMEIYGWLLYGRGNYDIADQVAEWKKYYEEHLSFMPSIMTTRYAGLLETAVSELQVDRTRVMNPVDLSRYQDLVQRVQAHITKMEGHRIKLDVGFVNLFTTLSNYVRNAQYMAQKSHPEPVSILIYGPPGVGKTFFVQQIRQYLTKNGKNSIYDYNPTDGTSDFHDRYDNHNWWIHEDIGRRGANDWGPYIPMLAVNPCRLDGAALDKKSTIFFNSQVVLGTTNTDLCAEKLKWEKGCGWIDANAVKRRWIVLKYINVVEADGFRHGSNVCKSYKLNYETGRWNRYVDFDCSSAQAFVDQVRDLYKNKVVEFEKYILSLHKDEGATYSFGDIKAEGRTKQVTMEIPSVEIDQVDDLPFVYAPRVQKVTLPDGSECEMSMTPTDQQGWLDRGYLINGGTSIVGPGPIHIGDAETWKDWLYHQWLKFKESSIQGLDKLVTGFNYIYDTFMSLPVEWQIGVGVFAAFGLIAVSAATYYLTQKEKQHEYAAFVAYGKSVKKQTAKELFAEGFDLGLEFQLPPSAAIKAIQKNILKCCFSYDVYHAYGFAIAANAETIIMNAHFLMYGTKVPTEIFIKGEDSTQRELVSAFFVVERIDLEEDLAVLKYRGPHSQLFRSLNKSMLKEPSSKDLFIVCTDGVIPIGSPTRAEFTSGLYRVGRRAFAFKEGIAHHYDGKAMGALGLCGSLAVTLDGYIVGWHVAGNGRGTGYVRFWNKDLKNFVLGVDDTIPIPIKETSDIKGAIELEQPIYRHVSLESGISPSAMLAPMMKSEILCPGGKPLRVPAELGGKVMEDGVEVGTYDRSRKKNLIVPPKPVNMAALKFARQVIHKRLEKILKGNKIPVLTEEEIVNGFNDERGVLRPMNKEASAGHPIGGLVGDWMQNGKIHSTVKSMMETVERDARRGNVKCHTSVVFTDQNKDEMRDYEKREKPRCFAAGPVHYTALIRKYFGALCAMTMKSRMDHGIMIGINATSPEWSMMWKKLCLWPNHFDGDYAMWDGGMRKEFQEELNEELSFWSTVSVITRFILAYLYETTRIGKSLSYVTTHTVPSGHGITALYNSYINEMYLAYAWYIAVGQYLDLSEEALVQRFFIDIFGVIYGDDLAVGVADSIKNKFNAIIYASVMGDLGLGFTTSTKKPHIKPFMPLRDITFLKRRFFAHRLINDIVGPLDLNVLKASAGFVHDSVRDEEITRQKMNSLQRELFLHSAETYKVVWGELRSCYYQAFGVECPELSEVELRHLYWTGELRSDLFELYAESGGGRLPSRRSNKRNCLWKESTSTNFN